MALGLVNRLAAPGRLAAEVEALATRLAVGPTEADARTKALILATIGDIFGALDGVCDHGRARVTVTGLR